MCDCNIVTECAYTGSTVVLLARVKRTDNAYAQQADVTSVTVTAAPLAPAASGTCGTTDGSGDDGSFTLTPAVADVVKDALVTGDSRWTRDSTGYNVITKITTPTVPGAYDVRMKLVMVNGDTLVVGYVINAE